VIDCHMHSDCSGDCTAPMLDMCAAAVDRGLKIICFTEHIDFEPTDVCYRKYDYDLYKGKIAEARKAFDGVLDIRCGIEVDFVTKYRSQIGHLLATTEFDYVLGASHYVDGVILEDHEIYFPGKTADEAYAPFFDNVLAAVETGWFDTLAHLDLCKRYGVRYYGPFDSTPYKGIIEQILRAVISRGMSLEINTSGLRQSPEDTYPSLDLLRLYASLGGKLIAVGSDSHKPQDVGAGIDTALDAVRALGLTSVSTYSARNRVPVSII
jgi:histidinol-phosphatase (PHP family)